MGVAEILKDIADGLAAFAPALGKSIWDLFCALFLTLGEGGAVSGLNVLGTFSLVALIMGMTYKLLPIAINWISRKVSARRRRRSRA